LGLLAINRKFVSDIKAVSINRFLKNESIKVSDLMFGSVWQSSSKKVVETQKG